MSRSSIPGARYAERLDRARQATRAAGLRALLVGVGADLVWLTGYHALESERLTLLVVPADGPAALVQPRLEVGAAEVAPAVSSGLVDVRPWMETDDPLDAVQRALAGSATGAGFAVSDTLRASFLLRLQAALPSAGFGSATPVLGPLRRAKDAQEVALLRVAAHAADRTVTAIAHGLLVGRTEAEVAREVRDRLVAEGHDAAVFAIVAGGPNSASPHHDASDRVISAGEPLLLDIGGEVGGYHSDITRTVWVTGGDASAGPDDAFRALHALVAQAALAARAAVRPGVAAQDLDRTARRVIDAGGHGEHFFHRLGHGIGLEGHEDPYLVEGNSEPIAVGDAFSVEPGIYLPGRYGARIEDIVVCGAAGPDVLNQAPRDLLLVSGR